jgi:putative DNA primase/helicase
MNKKTLLNNTEKQNRNLMNIDFENGTLSEIAIGSENEFKKLLNLLPSENPSDGFLAVHQIKYSEAEENPYIIRNDSWSDSYEAHNTDIHNLHLPTIAFSDLSQDYIAKHDESVEELDQQSIKTVLKKELPQILPMHNLNTGKETARSSRKPFDYLVMMQFIGLRTVRCCSGMVFLYNEEFGCYEEQSEAALHVAIRKSLDLEMNMKLGKQKITDVVHRIISNPDLQVNHDDFDRHTHLINFKNSVFNLESGTYQSHSTHYLFTSYIDAQYGEAPPRSGIRNYIRNGSSRSEGHYFKNFLEDCTEGDLLKKKSLQQLTGYIISNEWRAKKFFVLLGLPHTGKSVWLTLWQSFIGNQYTTAMSLKQLGETRFMSAELFKSKLNVTAEMDENGVIKGTDVIKAITGGDLITAEKKGKDPFQFYGKTKLVAAGNHMPLLNKLDGTSAFTDRILFLIFNNTIPEEHRDKSLVDKLLAEKTYIVKWAIEGLQELKRNNLVFAESDDARAFKQQYLNELNTVPEFVREECDIDLYNDDFRVHRNNLYPAYTRFCHDNGLKAVSKQEFFVEIVKLNVKPDKFRMKGTTGLWGFKGIRIKPKTKSKSTEEINAKETDHKRLHCLQDQANY